MAFQLKANESVRVGLARNVKHEIETAVGLVAAKTNARTRDAHEIEAVHDVRKCFKKVRAALRLVREDLGDDAYRTENFAFRDAARPLTEVRDAQMLVETWDKLAGQLKGELDSAALAKVRDALLAHQGEVTHRVLREGKALVAVKDFATRALVRLSTWKIERDGWTAMESNFRHVYRTAHRAFAAAVSNPSVANLHEWRKQTKYLWHQLQLLEPTWTKENELADRFHKLSQLLGDDHDLAVLRELLAADPLTYGGQRPLKALFAPLDGQRKALEAQAFTLGRQLYHDAPKAFTSRFTPPPPKKRAAPAKAQL